MEGGCGLFFFLLFFPRVRCVSLTLHGVRYIAASTNTQTLFLSNSSIGRQNQSKKKTFPADKMAKQGPPDKNSNFGLALPCKKKSETPNIDDEGDFEDVQVTKTGNKKLYSLLGRRGLKVI